MRLKVHTFYLFINVDKLSLKVLLKIQEHLKINKKCESLFGKEK